MKTYSQNGEDIKVLKCFPDGFIGMALEVGSWEPKNLSNSRLFIELGWSAVLCEFSPEPVRQLVREYADNPRVQVIQAAITPGPEHVTKFRITDDALSTNDARHLAVWEKAGGFFGDLWVPTLSMDALLSQFFGDRRIHVASIDTEGTSVDVGLALLRTDHRPKVLIVEHNNRDTEIMQVATKHGYVAIERNQENLILRCDKWGEL